ncbi:hypothetical protein FJU08_19220 [Martelella alba]|uniref:Uncharacterized protein n=1 Tax=Martelella alba TaxID=2590451 RepID=A0A506U5L7_9HYPH|nr:hypothetical protein [Martelella alba]TPW27859.1 hypothetical protein FJU08_19220 [Martelella alba]
MEIENYLLCRPHGGLNDMLVQIELCRAYAASHARVLVVDMNRSGWKDDFQRYFEPLPGFGPVGRAWSMDMARHLAEINDVVPAEIGGRIRDYQFSQAGTVFLLAGSDIRLSFDFSVKHDARLLVHEQCGGGLESIDFLRHVRFTSEAANAILRRIIPLGADYDAIHVRHTDMKTDYQGFLKRIAPALAGRRVLLCTDSHAVQQEAPGLLAGCAEVLTLGAVPDTGDLGLHYHNEGDVFERNLGSLADLVALACSNSLYFTSVRDGDNTARVSGFSLLAEGLHHQPKMIRALMGAADGELRAIFENLRNAAGRPDLSIRQLLARNLVNFGQLYWNREARKRVRRLHRRIEATVKNN